MKVAILGRVSTTEQKEGKTIESQLAELREFAKQKDYEVVDEYIEDGWSGAVLERPELDRLRNDSKNGKFEGILIHHPDRLSRVQLHQLLLLDEFEKNKIEVIFAKLPEFSNQSEESKVINKSVWSMVSELERLRIRERTRRGRRNKAENGLVVGHIPPYGYTYVKKDRDNDIEGYYKLNKEQAEVIKMIFEWAKSGMSEHQITKRLTEMKIPRPTDPKDSRKARWVWARSTVHKILKNRTYVGVTFYNKYESVEPENPINGGYKKRPKSSRRLRSKKEWIPIKLPSHLHLVSKEDFNYVQKLLAENSTHSLRNTKYKYLLRGLVKCSKCGSPYYANSAHGRPNYRCGNKMRNFPLPKTCEGGSISANIIEPLVWKEIKKAIKNPKLILEQAKISDNKAALKENDNKDTVELLAKIKKEEKRLLDACRQGAIEIDQLKAQMKEVKIRKEALAAQKKVDKPPFKLASKGIRWLCRELNKALKKLFFEEKQKFLRLLIEEIIISRNRLIIKAILPIYEKVEPKRQIAPTTFL